MNSILKCKLGEKSYTILQYETAKWSIYSPVNYAKTDQGLFIIKSIYKTLNNIYLVCEEVKNLEPFLQIDFKLSEALGIYTTHKEEYSESKILTSATEVYTF